MELQSAIRSPIASINGVALNTQDEALTADELRQRACAELLRQAAIAEDLLDANDAGAPDGILSERASSAIELLLEQALTIPEPSEAACRRHHAAHQSSYSSGEKVRVRHILFAVTPGVDVAALRQRAEGCLLDVRCHDGSAADSGFAKAASTLSNCPSGAQGGELGWLGASDCAPEFGKELFGQTDVGVLPPAATPDVYLVNVGEAAARFALQAGETLRDAGLDVLLHGGGGSFTSQMKKADASGARHAVIIGDDEAAAAEVTVKPLRGEGEQQRVALVAAVELLKG